LQPTTNNSHFPLKRFCYLTGRPPGVSQIKKAGFAGVQNFPTVGLIDGNFRSPPHLCGGMHIPHAPSVRNVC
jgi:hypothetical protein